MADDIKKDVEGAEESAQARIIRAEQELEVARRQLENYRSQEAAQEGITASLAEQAELQSQIEKLEAKRREAHFERLKELEREAKLLVEHGQLTGEDLEKAREALRVAQNNTKELQAQLDIAERKRALEDESDKWADKFIGRWTGLQKGPSDDLLSRMIFQPGRTFGSLAKGAKLMAQPLNLVAGASLKAAEASIALGMEQDKSVVNFRRATGASGELDDNIRGLERAMFDSGVTSAEASQAIQSLFLGVSDFTAMSEASQIELSKTVAVLNELGVSSENSAKNIQFAIKVLGQSTKQAAKLQRELFVFAQGLGLSADQVASDFASMGPQIAALGANGVDAFKKLEIQVKNTGLAMTEILGLVEKFDTFDSAAQSVAKLNALLGGPYLNTLELVATTDPSERFRILKERVDDAGISFDNMDYYQRKAMASAMGLNEQQLALMMRGSLDAIMPKPKSAEDIEALAKQTAQFNTLMEEAGQIVMAFAVSFGPLISGIKTVIQFIQPLIPYIIGIGTALIAIFTPIGWVGTALGVLAGALVTLTAAWADFTHGMQFGFSMTPTAALEMTGKAIGNITSLINPLTAVMSPISSLFGDMSHGAEDLADSMSLIPSTKAASFVSTIEQTTNAVKAVSPEDITTATKLNAVAMEGTTPAPAPTPTTAPAPAAPGFTGDAPPINVILKIDGTEIATVVNAVAAEAAGPNSSGALYKSISDMIAAGFNRSA